MALAGCHLGHSGADLPLFCHHLVQREAVDGRPVQHRIVGGCGGGGETAGFSVPARPIHSAQHPMDRLVMQGGLMMVTVQWEMWQGVNLVIG